MFQNNFNISLKYVINILPDYIEIFKEYIVFG